VTLPANFTLLQVVPELETGGAEQTTIDVAHAVVQAGGRAFVATRGGRMTSRLEADGARLAQMPVQSKNPLVMLGNAARLVDLIRRENVSIVHARSRAPAFSALWAAKSTGTAFVATYHGVYNADSKLKRWYNAVMTRGDLVIANSDYTRDHILAEHGVAPEKVVTIARGVDLSRFNPTFVTPDRVEALRKAWGFAANDRRVKFILAGRFTRIKGHLLVVAAAAGLRAMGHKDFLVLFVGDPRGRDDYVAEVTGAIAASGVTENVRIVGHCDDMPAAYLAADIAMMPTTVPESFGRTAVEPQAMGRTVIAAEHGAAVETVVGGETGWLARPNDPAAWTAAMARAIEAGPGKLAAMGQAGANRTTRLYSVDAMCAATLAAYGKVLEARAHAKA
jgi:glycosyltransferase involved in cell wall biosynthesis